MGCDIHSHVEVRDPETGKWSECHEEVFPEWDNRLSSEPFGQRNYGMFAFFTHTVRNYSAVPPVLVSEPRGVPDDSPYSRKSSSKKYDPYDRFNDEDYIYGDNHSHSYLMLRELAEFDYDQPFEDRRVTRQTGPNSWDGGCTGDPGEGEMTTYREFLGEGFMKHLEILKTFGGLDDVRIVFWFDN